VRINQHKTDEKALGSLDQIDAIEDRWLVISCKLHRCLLCEFLSDLTEIPD